MNEELGIPRDRLQLIEHSVFLYEDAKLKTFGGLWTAVYDGCVHVLYLDFVTRLLPTLMNAGVL